MINNFQGRYRFLSNFFPSIITVDGITYPTVEHAFQASKTADMGTRRELSMTKKPGDAKRIGRLLFLRPDWEEVKIDVMRTCLSKKFSYESNLAQRLLETGNEELIEGNTWNDTFWGVCNGIGENWLGRLLMERREILRQSQHIYYAGIGSRRTPDDVCELMTAIAQEMASRGVILRSGGARGADKAFEIGAGSLAEIYHADEYKSTLTVERSNGDRGTHFYGSPDKSYNIAARFHPSWDSCSSYARDLHARNVSQILGWYPKESPISSSVICWTPDGSLDGSTRTCGGTGQALRIAATYGIHVVNLQRLDHREMTERWLQGKEVNW